MSDDVTTIIITIFLFVIFMSSAVFVGYKKGREDAFSSIILESCWLNKQSRDIECIEQIDLGD